jgi:uncharacterized protein (TIGR02145 family)
MKKIFLTSLIVLILGCSKEDSPSTNPTSLTDLDGNTYTAITIGKQTWYKENLSVSKYSDGTEIPQVNDPSEWATLTTGAWCYYDDDSSTEEVFGKLYNWYAVAGIYNEASLNTASLRKKLAPQGHHIPSDLEWTALSNELGSNAGGKLKQEGTEFWYDTNDEVTNSTGFNGLPGGICIDNGSFHLLGYHGYWWTSSTNDIEIAWNRSLNYNTNILCRSYDSKKYGFSVRFIKD